MKKSSNTANIVNRRAKFDYELVDCFLAGLVLTGAEVKSIRVGQADLSGSYITINNDEAWLVGAHIAQYKYASELSNYDPARSRKLLLKKNELAKLIAAKQQKMTIVPSKLFTKKKYIKIEICTARGKKQYDKRQTIKRRDTDRDVARSLKNR